MDFISTKKKLKRRIGKVIGDSTYYVDLLFDSLKRYCDACEMVEKEGLTIQTNQRAFVHPAVNVANEAHKQMLRLMELLEIKPEGIVEEAPPGL